MSDNVENTETPVENPTEAPMKPLEVKVTNPDKKETKWNDDRDDMEYDEIILTKEDMDI